MQMEQVWIDVKMLEECIIFLEKSINKEKIHIVGKMRCKNKLKNVILGWEIWDFLQESLLLCIDLHS